MSFQGKSTTLMRTKNSLRLMRLHNSEPGGGEINSQQVKVSDHSWVMGGANTGRKITVFEEIWGGGKLKVVWPGCTLG